VAPLRIARGVQNKVLEAMWPSPLVATREAAPLRRNPACIFDDDARVCGCNHLRHSGKERSEIARHAREYVEHHHDWTRNLALPTGCSPKRDSRRRSRRGPQIFRRNFGRGSVAMNSHTAVINGITP
jgi:hypothetical protein